MEDKIAVFIDLENLVLGDKQPIIGFNIQKILERLLEKGKIVAKRAYCDWEKYPKEKLALHGAAIDLIEIPHRGMTGKNSADIRLVVDALDMCFSKEHPLVSKLKENGKTVIGVGRKQASSELLISNCDEFIFYEDLFRPVGEPPKIKGLPRKKAQVMYWLIDALQALMRENKEVLLASTIKQTIKRKRPFFDEGEFGYDSFSELLEDAQANGIIKLDRHSKSGTYVVTGYGSKEDKPAKART
ncbi:MAG: NYN domain-containing protein [Chlorobi bacterium CHB1]|nr:NYN domain-containing protein [Chlorobi bacterium CHB1]